MQRPVTLWVLSILFALCSILTSSRILPRDVQHDIAELVSHPEDDLYQLYYSPEPLLRRYVPFLLVLLRLPQPDIVSRQQDSCEPFQGPNTPLCRPLCVPDNYLCSTTPIDKRGSRYWPTQSSESNGSFIGVETPTQSLVKRVFQEMTQGELDDYVEGQFFPKDPPSLAILDTRFGEPLGTVSADERSTTVFEQVRFGVRAFQISGGPLHGCTQVVVVGDTGVWMVSSPHSDHGRWVVAVLLT